MRRDAETPRAGLLLTVLASLAGPLAAEQAQGPEAARTALLTPPRRPPAADPARVDRSRFLRPEVLERLSSGGQRLVRHLSRRAPRTPRTETAEDGSPASALPAARRAGAASVRPPAAAPRPLGPPAPRQNVRVNDPGMDETGHTNNQSAIAVRGARIVVGFNDASENVAGYAVSEDGGATFTHRRLPPPSDGTTFGDAGVAFGPGGEVYTSTLIAVAGGWMSSVGVARSTDGGATFSEPADAAFSIANEYDVQDRPALAVDASASSRHAGNVYVTWTDFLYEGQTVIGFARSTDGGTTFGRPVALSPVDFAGVTDPAIAVAPDGAVYVAYRDRRVAPESITLVKSTDGGASWAGRKTVATLQPLRVVTGGGGVRVSSAPSLAADGSGGVHVVWAAATAGTTLDRADVFHARSTDGGSTFAAARKLNDDGTSTTQTLPAIAVAGDGTVAVRWACRRFDVQNDGLTGVFVALSRDRGATFGTSFRVTDSSWAYGPVERSLAEGYHGGYDGITADGASFYLSWSDERGGDPDVYFATVPSDFDATAPDFDVSGLSLHRFVLPGAISAFELATTGVNAFAEPLQLAVSSKDPALAATLSRATVAPGEAVVLTVSASLAARPGDRLLTVTAAAGGLVRATNVRLTVLDPSRGIAPPANITETSGITGSGGVRADAEGRLHLVYEDDTQAVRGDDVFYRRSTDGGATFSQPRKLSPAGSVAVDPVAATGPPGRVVAVWTGTLAGESRPRLFVARSTDGGASFSTAAAITPADQYPLLPAVAMNASGHVLLAWYDVSNGYELLLVRRSTDGGATFEAAAAIDEGEAAAISRPGLAYDSKGAAYLTYTQQAALGGGLLSGVGLAIARDGRSFAAPRTLSDVRVANAYGPDVAVGPDDGVCLAYYNLYGSSDDDANRDVVFVRSTDGGATFSAETEVSRSSGQSRFPTVAVEPGGGIVVAWEDEAGNAQTDVFASRSTDGGTTFARPVNLSASPGLSGSSANPVDGLGGSGRVSAAISGSRLVVSWLDDSGANPDVLMTTLDPVALSNAPPAVSVTTPSSGTTVEVGVAVPFIGTGSDPDGEPVSLAWDFGDGTTAAGALPAPHPFAHPGTYTVALVGRDARGGVGTASVTVGVTAPAASGTSLLVPVVIDAPGLGGSRYTTELTLASRGSGPTDVVLGYTGSKGGGAGFARLTLAAGELRIIPGIVAWLRARNVPIPVDGDDGGGNAGTLLVSFGAAVSPGEVFAGARTFTADPAGGPGTFGLFYAAAKPSEAGATVTGLQQTAALRSNLALANAGSDPVTLRVALVGPSGEDLGTFPDQLLGPYAWAQLDQPLLGKAAAGRAVVTRVSGSGPFTAYGVLNDAVTSDGSFLPPLLGGDASGASRLVPVVLDVAGVGARFRSELTLANLTASPLPLTLTYRAAPGFGSGSGSVPLTLAASEQRIFPDAIAFLRQTLPIEADGRDVAGSLVVAAPAGLPANALAAGARTFVPLSPAGSYGVYTPGLTLAESATSVAWVHGLQEGEAQRSNLALVNRGDAGDAVTLRVTLVSASGAALGAPVDRTLQPGEFLQLARPLAASGAASGSAKVERVSGSSRFVAYGVLNDNVTSDGSVLAMSP